jgi:hypothetical protein
MIKTIPRLTDHQLELFWAKVQKSDCWIWTAATVKGYGSFGINGKTYLAHRISYSIAYEDPLEMCVCHSCDNPLCVNPNHLWLGTMGDNDLDRDQKSRQARGTGINTNILTEQQAIEILGSKKIDRVLAVRYGVTKGTINAIRNGRNWKHLKGKRRTSKDAFANSKTGVRGVSPIRGGKFQATATLKGRHHYLGLFVTTTEAKQYREKWIKDHEQTEDRLWNTSQRM